MAGAFGYLHGGIAGLLSLLDEHQGAIEFDLIERGLRLDQLGTDALSWRDLVVIVGHLPPSSALARAVEPDVEWQLQPQLLAALVDELRTTQHLLMQWASGGKHKGKAPEPIPRPGVKPKADTTTHGANEGFDSADDLAEWYAGLDLQPAPN